MMWDLQSAIMCEMMRPQLLMYLCSGYALWGHKKCRSTAYFIFYSVSTAEFYFLSAPSIGSENSSLVNLGVLPS